MTWHYGILRLRLPPVTTEITKTLSTARMAFMAVPFAFSRHSAALQPVIRPVM